jgi:hypothetical protein
LNFTDDLNREMELIYVASRSADATMRAEKRVAIGFAAWPLGGAQIV